MGCWASRAAVDNFLKERSGTNFGKESDLETVIQNMENNQKSTLTEIIKIEYFEKVEHEELKEAQKWIIAAKYSDGSEVTYANWLAENGQLRIDHASF